MSEILPNLVSVHHYFAEIGRWVSLAMIVWVGLTYWRRIRLGASFYGLILVFETLILMQTMIGILFFFGLGWRPVEWVLHLLYAALIIITFPIVFLYTRNEPDPRRIAPVWIYGFLFMFGAMSRAVLTGAMG